jgi:YidC/Oxa1 family membrane protein insertase
MEKRLLLAIALSFLVLGVYTSLLPRPQLTENKSVVSDLARNLPQDPLSSVSPATLPQAAAVVVEKPLQEKELYSIESSEWSLKFSKKGGYLAEVFDKTHNIVSPIKDIGLVPEWAGYSFDVDEITRGVVFSYKSLDGLEIKKTFRIKAENALELAIDINGVTDLRTTGYTIFGGVFRPSLEKDQMAARYYESCAIVNGIAIRKSAVGQKKALSYDGHILWAALRDRYSCALIYPQINVNKGVIDIVDKDVRLLFSIPERTLGQGEFKIEDKYKIYIGLQDEKSLKDFGEGAERLINYGTFDSISKILLFFLKMAYKISKNWGVAIILITIFVYFLLFPLSFKSMISMKKMQSLQPKIEELRSKFKDNPQKLNTEIMGLYKTEKVNPFGGCVPMILQIPVFFALYQLLMRFISLRGAPFLWVKDLAATDKLIVFKTTYPIIGNELNILPLLMAAGMFFQQKMTATQATSPETAQQQKIMTIMMPVLFGALFYKLPAGLVLYWFVNSLLMLAFQWKISRIKV